jgi:hypothetical protein
VLPLFMLLALAPVLAARSIATAWSLAPVVGLFLYRITIVMHDCVHRTLFRSPQVNDWIGLLLGAVTGIDPPCSTICTSTTTRRIIAGRNVPAVTSRWFMSSTLPGTCRSRPACWRQ